MSKWRPNLCCTALCFVPCDSQQILSKISGGSRMICSLVSRLLCANTKDISAMRCLSSPPFAKQETKRLPIWVYALLVFIPSLRAWYQHKYH
jgi:hypothetical protein